MAELSVPRAPSAGLGLGVGLGLELGSPPPRLKEPAPLPTPRAPAHDNLRASGVAGSGVPFSGAASGPEAALVGAGGDADADEERESEGNACGSGCGAALRRAGSRSGGLGLELGLGAISHSAADFGATHAAAAHSDAALVAAVAASRVWTSS